MTHETSLPDEIRKSIEKAQRQMTNERIEHEKRAEFWNGYIAAMQQIQQQIKP